MKKGAVAFVLPALRQITKIQMIIIFCSIDQLKIIR